LAPSDTLRPVELYSTGDYEFGYVSASEPLDNGGLAVADHFLNQVVLFGPDGLVTGTLGTEGDGPGEFKALASVAQLASGEIATLSHNTSRITVFGEEVETYRTTLRGHSQYLNGRIGAGPVVYAEERGDTAQQLVRANTSGSAPVDAYLPLPAYGDHLPLYQWVVDGEMARKGHPYAGSKSSSINRYGDYALMVDDTAVVVGNLLGRSPTRVLVVRSWPEIEQKNEVIDSFFSQTGRPPEYADLPPIYVSSVYIDDSGRVWLGRTAYRESESQFADYTAIVVNPATMDSQAVVLPKGTHFFLEHFRVRGDRATAVIDDEYGDMEVRVLDLSGLAVVGPR